jgi:hypothetical protein
MLHTIRGLHPNQSLKQTLIAIIIVFVCWPIFANEYAPQEGYSFAPLVNPIFDYPDVDVAAFNNWLNSNYSSLTDETMKGPREHLYYLLCSYVSALYEKDKVVMPKEHDMILEIIFSWSERLGVYGGSLAYNQIKNEDKKPMPELMEVPDTFSISLDNDLYSLATTSKAWSVKFPYYFMIGNINDFTATNGMQTQLVSISTGATKDKTKTGRSQGTLMLIYSPSNKFDSFSKYWLSQFDISSETKLEKLEVKALKSRSTYDEASLLHKELFFWPSEAGSFAVAYLGMDGTYQANRQHFLDFLTQINVPQETTANKSLNQDAQ